MSCHVRAAAVTNSLNVPNTSSDSDIQVVVSEVADSVVNQY